MSSVVGPAPAAVVVLVGCREFPGGEPDTAGLAPALVARGVSARWASWDDAEVAWADAALVVLRATWDYTTRRPEFLRWADGVPNLANPAAVVRWNSDKTYLRDLAAAGVPVVATTWIEPGSALTLPPADGASELVVKPTVGAGSLGAGRFGAGPDLVQRAQRHVDELHAQGRTAMVQPYLATVDTDGETSLIFLGGGYSHAARKGPMLPPGTVHGLAGRDELFVAEQITAREATGAQLAVARAALAAVPDTDADGLLYARVDLVPGPDGPVVMEVELTEPSLFLQYADGATDRFADVIAAAADPRLSSGAS